MLFIVEHKFTVGERQKAPARGGSVTEQIALMKRPSRVGISPDCVLEVNHQYKILHITPVNEEGERSQRKVKYLFQDLRSNQVVEKVFNSCAAADEFIAEVSGDLTVLHKQRAAIARATE